MLLASTLCGESDKTSKPGKNRKSFIIVQGPSVEIHFKSGLSKQETKKKKSKYNGKSTEVIGKIVKLRDRGVDSNYSGCSRKTSEIVTKKNFYVDQRFSSRPHRECQA